MFNVKPLFAALCAAVIGCASADVVDAYNFTASLKVPQVVDNYTSRGKRVYKKQKITGIMYIIYKSDGGIEIDFDTLYNQNFKVAGRKVSYECSVESELLVPRFTYIGDNAKDKFKTATICFYMVAYPSYAIGSRDEDNSLYIMLAGKGTTSTKLVGGARLPKKFAGYVCGTQGCSCAAYMHKSPTRTATACGPSDTDVDVAATFGTWKATYFRRGICAVLN